MVQSMATESLSVKDLTHNRSARVESIAKANAVIKSDPELKLEDVKSSKQRLYEQVVAKVLAYMVGCLRSVDIAFSGMKENLLPHPFATC